VDSAPDLWRELMELSRAAASEGAELWPQVAARATGLVTGHDTTYCLFDVIPAYRDLRRRHPDIADLARALATPDVRRSIVEWDPDPETAARLEKAFCSTYVLGSPPDYEPGPERSLAGMAAASGRSPMDVAYDAMLENSGRGLLYVPILNYSGGDLEPAREMLTHPRSAAGLGDGGAHCGVICDASQPTFMLTHWVRDRTRGERLPLEWAVRKQTRDTAALYGLEDRGVLAPGMVADVNVIDYERLQLGSPRVVSDLPAGGKRLVQDATGYVATIKSGEPTFEDGKDTGARPGRLLRGGRRAPAA
jgi:N-acyl-D-amino-acid deacylase